MAPVALSGFLCLCITMHCVFDVPGAFNVVSLGIAVN